MSILKEIIIILKLSQIFGSQPLKLLFNNDKNEYEINFKFLSYENLNCIIINIIIIYKYLNQFLPQMSIARNIVDLTTLLLRFSVLKSNLKINSLFIKINEFDNIINILRNKKPFINYKNRSILWLIIVVIYITSYIIAWTICYSDFQIVGFLILCDVPYIINTILYIAVSIGLIQRQNYLINECRLLFYQLKTNQYKGPDSAIPFMKIRHLQLILKSCYNLLNDTFAFIHLCFFISSYVFILYSITLTRVLKMNIIKHLNVFNVFPNYFIMFILIFFHLINCTLNRNLQLKVSNT